MRDAVGAGSVMHCCGLASRCPLHET